MIHYISIGVSDLRRSGEFYDAILAPLGWRRQYDEGSTIGWGLQKPVFYISSQTAPGPSFGNLCFAANGVAAIKAAFEAAMQRGGIEAGPPGSQPRYGVGYYSAFVTDPDGYQLELTVAPE